MVCRILTQSDPKSQKISNQPTSKMNILNMQRYVTFFPYVSQNDIAFAT